MTIIESSLSGWRKRGGVFLMFFALATMVFAIMPLSARLPIDILLTCHVVLTAILLIASLLMQRSGRWIEYRQVCYVFFVAGVAVLLSMLFSGSLLDLCGLTVATPRGIAVAKL